MLHPTHVLIPARPQIVPDVCHCRKKVVKNKPWRSFIGTCLLLGILFSSLLLLFYYIDSKNVCDFKCAYTLVSLFLIIFGIIGLLLPLMLIILGILTSAFNHLYWMIYVLFFIGIVLTVCSILELIRLNRIYAILGASFGLAAGISYILSCLFLVLLIK